MDFPTIAIVGSGAVGGYYGSRLAQHGQSVHFLLRSDYDAVRRNGWKIKSCAGDFAIPPEKINVHNHTATMPRVDLVVVTLKATSNDQFESLIGPLLKPGTGILTLQNGLGNEEHLAGLFGPQRILGGLAFTCINRIGPGQIDHSDHGLIRLGEFGGGTSSRARAIAELFNRSHIHCQVLEDLRFGRWEKLVWNVPFNGLGAAMDLTTDRVLAGEGGEALVRQIMSEVVQTAAAIGVMLPSEIIDKNIEHTGTMGSYHTSMQIDRQHRRPLERKAIVESPLRIAEQNGVKTPFLLALNSLLSVFDCIS